MRMILGVLLLTMPLAGCGFGCSLSSAVIDEQSNVLASTYTTNNRFGIGYAQLETTHAGNATLGNND